MTTITTFWHYILAMGAKHGVNPTVFAVLYIIHHPLFWGTVTWIVVRVKRRLVIWPHCILAAAFWLMPYTYIALSVKNLPWYVEVGIGIVFLFGLYKAVQEVRKKIREIAHGNEEKEAKSGAESWPPPPRVLKGEKAEVVE